MTTTATRPAHLVLLRTTYRVAIPVRFGRDHTIASVLAQRIMKAIPAEEAVVTADYTVTELTFTVRNYRGRPFSEIEMGKTIAEILTELEKV